MHALLDMCIDVVNAVLQLVLHCVEERHSFL